MAFSEILFVFVLLVYVHSTTKSHYIKHKLFIYWFWSFLGMSLSSFTKLLCFLLCGFFLFIAAIVLLYYNSTAVSFIWRRTFELFWVLFQLYEPWTFVGLFYEKFLFCISKIYGCLIFPQKKKKQKQTVFLYLAFSF